MSEHLNHQQLIGYIHQTLSDDQREVIDRHLATCPACRGQLADHDRFQHRIRYDLTADLRAIQPPGTTTFQMIAPRLDHRRSLLFRQLAVRMTAAVAAAALLITLVVVLADKLQQPATNSTGLALAANQAADFAALGVNPGADGWFLAGSTPQNYESGIDHAVTHDGRSSGYISSTVRSSEGFGTLMQMFKADDYRGKRLRLSAYVKTERVDSCGLWMRIDGPGNEMISLDNMQNRPIHWTTDWQKVEVVLDVPQNSVDIAFGVLLQGAGRVWIDDIQFEAVGADISTTAIQVTTPTSETPMAIRVTPAPSERTVEQQPANLDFETGSTGWSAADSDTQEYVSGIDPIVAHLGRASGSVESIVSKPTSLGLLRQSVKADEYRDKRVRVSGYLKTDRLNGTAYFLMTIYSQQDQMIYVNSHSINTSTDWQWIWFVLNVPANSDRLEYGLALRGEGQAWIDDVSIEFVGDSAETSSFETSPIQYGSVGLSQPDNLDFESGANLRGWFNSGNTDYEVGVDHGVIHSGGASAHIKSKATVSGGSYEVLSQFVRADSYRGKRLRLSGYIKTNQVEGWAGMWLNIADSGNQLLGLDNMQNRPITGTSDWQKYEIVLDIPEDGAVIGFGILLQGKGEIWWDDVKLEAVGPDVPTTHPYQQQPLNLDFENSK